jgi:hypothetical protein
MPEVVHERARKRLPPLKRFPSALSDPVFSFE